MGRASTPEITVAQSPSDSDRHLALSFQANDDWRGFTDPALRKKLQNKINQRTLRKLLYLYYTLSDIHLTNHFIGARKRLERKNAVILQSKDKLSDLHRYALILPRSDRIKDSQLVSSRPTSLYEAVALMSRFNKGAYERYHAADPCIDQLFTLSKFNVLRAFLDNMASLGLIFEAMADDALSPFNITFPKINDKGIPPASLSPTPLQYKTLHHPWLDCFPFPRMRDNLIMASESFDDCELCTDMMDPTNGDIGVMVWGDPWLPQNWEVSQLFVHKWSWVIKGCPELLVSSNYWRAHRGLSLR